MSLRFIAVYGFFIVVSAAAAVYGLISIRDLSIATAASIGNWLRVQPVEAARSAEVAVNAAAEFQHLEGFGQAEPCALVYPGVPPAISDALRAAAIEKAFHEVGINMGTIGQLVESPGSWEQRQNDNDDPFTINWKGFSPEILSLTKQYLVDLAKPYGFTGYFLGAEGPNVRWQSPWLARIRMHDYGRFLDEGAEQVLANIAYWKNTYGEELAYYQLGNEQKSGNHASSDPDNEWTHGPVEVTQQVVDLVKRAGARLRDAGFNKTRFLVANEETESHSYDVASAVLNDRKAAQYVGAIGYHTYPYHQGYSSVEFILSTSGAGRPDLERVRLRNQIRDLAKAHHVGVWLTENSNAGDPFRYDTFRARAIQIHDEFLYANAGAYFAECGIWDEASQKMHFGNMDLSGAEGSAVFIHNSKGNVEIAGIGYAIGHYARWAKPGSVRIDSRSTDPLVQVTAFRDDAAGRLALVLINNSNTAMETSVTVKGAGLSGTWQGEQSTPGAYWQPLAALQPESSTTLRISLPPTSVTSVAGPMGNSVSRAVEK